MIIPMWVDEKKDEKLIKWLNDFTNRSATMRMYLYNCMNGNGKIIENKNNIEQENLDEDFVSSLDKF